MSVGDIVRATEGPIRLEGETTDADPPRPVGADEAEGLASRAFTSTVWAEIGERIEDLLDQITLESLCERAEQEGVPRSGDPRRLMYFI
ncbi:MAG: hypothetical protein D6729_15890 [Deltaproteobacteria bacterium]|nr:MAG: hypothetical protein D6729_15890 [Deltaproteobacteria bacterium]